MKKENMRSEGAVLRSSAQKRLRLISAAAVLLICCLVFVGAVGAATFSSGTGTEDDPFMISSVSDFNNITWGNDGYGIYYKLQSNIDFEYSSPSKFGVDHLFQGVFDGDGKTISNISYSGTPSKISLFGNTVKGPVKISNLTVTNISVTVSGNLYNVRYGTIATHISNLSQCVNCNVSNITVTLIPSETISNNMVGTIGGLVNNVENGGIVADCSVDDFQITISDSAYSETPLTLAGLGGITPQVLTGNPSNSNTYPWCKVTNCHVKNFNLNAPNSIALLFGGITGRITSNGEFSSCTIENVRADVRSVTYPQNAIYGIYDDQTSTDNTLVISGNSADGDVIIPGLIIPHEPDVVQPTSSAKPEPGAYFNYPRITENGGLVEFGTSKVVKSVNLPEGSSGKVNLHIDCTKYWPLDLESMFTFDISVENVGIGNAYINFEIAESRLNMLELTAADICAYHYEGEVWTKLPTTYEVKDGVVCYEAETDSFSPFKLVIEKGAAVPKEEEIVPTVPPTEEPEDTPVDEPEDVLQPIEPIEPTEPTTPAPLLSMLAGLGAAVLLRRK